MMRSIQALCFFVLVAFFLPAASYAVVTETAGGTGGDGPLGIAIDSNDNRYVTGYFSATVDFDPSAGVDNHTSAGGTDIFITKTNADGSYGWTKTMGGANGEIASGVAVDGNGNIFIAGYYTGTNVDFDPSAGVDNHTSQGQDGFLTKINANGTYGWTYIFGSNHFRGDSLASVAIDGNNNIFIAGSINGTVQLDPIGATDSVISTGTEHSSFLVKINANNSYGWSYVIQGTIYNPASAVTIDKNNDVLLTGIFRGNNTDFDPSAGVDQHTNSGNGMYVVKLNNAGGYLWAKTFGSGGNEGSYAVAADSNRNVYIAGLYRGTIDFNPPSGVMTARAAVDTGWGDIFMTKYASDGTYKWTKTIGAAKHDQGQHLAIDAKDNVYLSGYYANGPADFDINGAGDVHSNAGLNDAFITKYNADGSYGWTKIAGGASNEYGDGIAFDSSGNLHAVFRFSGTVDFDFNPSVANGNNKTSAGGLDIAVAKFSSPTATNKTQTVNFIGGTTTAIADMVTADADGDNLTIVITMAAGNATLGSLSASSGNGETWTAGTGVWTITGSAATLNTALAAMAFVPLADKSYVSTTATVSVTDAVLAPIAGSITFTGSINPDVDGDGMTNVWENANGLNQNDAADAAQDKDGDGLTNLQEFTAGKNPNLDDNPPVTTAPATKIVNATGLLTRVNVGQGTAVDGLDGSITPAITLIDGKAPAKAGTTISLKSGNHTFKWGATDAAGNASAAVNQIVKVVPMVELGNKQKVVEGNSVSVPVQLSGSAATYPVTIPYTVTGTATGGGTDYTLANGNVVINAPAGAPQIAAPSFVPKGFIEGVRTSINYTTVDDGTGDANETVIITLGTPTNAVLGSQKSQTTILAEGNLPPRVAITVSQGGVAGNIAETGSGSVVITATPNDPNGADAHTYVWSVSPAVTDTDGAAATFTFDPIAAGVGFYRFTATVTDDGAGALSDKQIIGIKVVAPRAALTGADSDDDGTADNVEGYKDSDGDGIPDYLDPSDQRKNVLPEYSGGYSMESEPGITLKLGRTAFNDGASGGAKITGGGIVSSSSNNPGTDTVTNVGGYFDFTLSGIIVGQSVSIVLPQSAAIPANAIYRKAINGAWVNFSEDVNNSLASAAGVLGICPAPGDAAYVAGLNAGDFCVQLTIEDGGLNDADAVANGTVEDPGGIGAAAANVLTYGNGGGGKAACSAGNGYGLMPLLIILGLVQIARVWRRKSYSSAI